MPFPEPSYLYNSDIAKSLFEAVQDQGGRTNLRRPTRLIRRIAIEALKRKLDRIEPLIIDQFV
ncbi:MAG: hypothetical protein OEZ01_06480 [Candidatus Heimdallarchaeota archaeon]|nr:hypothetical protein [Candidatus Heimdallarchaeota archaeon]